MKQNRVISINLPEKLHRKLQFAAYGRRQLAQSGRASVSKLIVDILEQHQKEIDEMGKPAIEYLASLTAKHDAKDPQSTNLATAEQVDLLIEALNRICPLDDLKSPI